MNWYEHHLGDWLKDTVGMSATAEGFYFRLVHWYYGHEGPLPAELVEVDRCARVANGAERVVMRKVLQRFFTLMPDGWHHPRCDRELAAYFRGRPKSEESKLAQSERQRLSREYRRELFATLRAAGVVPPMKTTNERLIELCTTVGVTAPSRQGVTARVTANGHDSHPPLPTSHDRSARAPAVTADVAAVTAERARAACTAMQAVGFEQVRPADPRLLQLLDDGVQLDALQFTAAEAKAMNKGWSWLMAVARGRHDDARMAPSRPSAGPSHADAWAELMRHQEPPGDDPAPLDPVTVIESVDSPRRTG